MCGLASLDGLATASVEVLRPKKSWYPKGRSNKPIGLPQITSTIEPLKRVASLRSPLDADNISSSPDLSVDPGDLVGNVGRSKNSLNRV